MPSNKKNEEVCPKYGLHSHMVSSEFREPFIAKGYRCENMSFVDCIKTMFVFKCNETFNIWTHLLPFLLFTLKFFIVFTKDFSLKDPFYWPLAANAVGIMGFCIASSIAHIFCALSLKARHTCFYTDYSAISIYAVTAWQSTYFYARPLSPDHSFLFGRPRLTMFLCVFISVICTIQSCLTRHLTSSMKHVLRVSSFVFPWLFAAAPYIYRILTCDNELDCEKVAFKKFLAHAVLYLTGALFVASKYPERLFPGSFDWFGQSHQIMHICTAIGAELQFESVKLDMVKRESEMRSQDINQLFSYDSPSITILTIIINLVIALGFNEIAKHFNNDNEEEEVKKIK